jgi:carboxymethylenebutenolidase
MSSYRDIAATDGSGKMKAYLAMPAGKPKAGIVVIQEIFGVNRDIRNMTDAWAAKGYAAIAPDLFWRVRPGVELDADVPEQFQEGLDLMQKFSADKGVEDIAACIANLRGDGCAKVGAVGYCLGGRLAFMCAARTDSDATVGYYGVGLENLLGEAGKIRKPLLLHIATRDKFSTPEAQAKVHAALKGNPLVTMHDYDADHAFARGSGSARVPALAQEADGRTEAFFAEKLK